VKATTNLSGAELSDFLILGCNGVLRMKCENTLLFQKRSTEKTKNTAKQQHTCAACRSRAIAAMVSCNEKKVSRQKLNQQQDNTIASEPPHRRPTMTDTPSSFPHARTHTYTQSHTEPAQQRFPCLWPRCQRLWPQGQRPGSLLCSVSVCEFPVSTTKLQ
jgi:hypothetical protein